MVDDFECEYYLECEFFNNYLCELAQLKKENAKNVRCSDNQDCYYRRWKNDMNYYDSYRQSCKINDKLTDKYIDSKKIINKISDYARKYFDYQNYKDILDIIDGKDVE